MAEKSRPKEMRGRITPESMARMRARIGILAPRPKPFNTVASEDSIRHYCYGYGEDNPLHTDPEYGAKTRWGSVIAPPAYMSTCGNVNAKPIPPDVREKGRAGGRRARREEAAARPETVTGTAEIVARGHEPETVKKIERLLYIAEYKRRQAAPGVKVSQRNFGRDRRYPITNGFREPL